jgi:CheY-like chemotaxis protein
MTRILLVEDNEFNRDMLGRRLMRRGFDMAYAVDGASAMSKAESECPDVILMDIGLGKDDGIDVTQQIRARAFGKDVPIIALTAHAMVADRDKCLAAGCNAFETKPVEFDRLLKTIGNCLGVGRSPASQSRQENDGLGRDESTMHATTPHRAVQVSLDQTALDAIRALESPDAPNFFADLVGTYLRNAQELLDEMQDGAKRSDAKVIAAAAHSLKSSSADVGAVTLSDLCKALEATSNQPGLAAAAKLVTMVAHEFDSVRGMLAAELSRSGAVR